MSFIYVKCTAADSEPFVVLVPEAESPRCSCAFLQYLISARQAAFGEATGVSRIYSSPGLVIPTASTVNRDMFAENSVENPIMFDPENSRQQLQELLATITNRLDSIERTVYTAVARMSRSRATPSMRASAAKPSEHSASLSLQNSVADSPQQPGSTQPQDDKMDNSQA
jgi:hypothetical protein